MELKSKRFDTTNPFAPLRQRANQIETILRQMPPAQRRQVLADLLPPASARHSPSAPEPAVQVVAVKEAEWAGGPTAQWSQPPLVPRPRRIARPIPWQWRLIVAGVQLTRLLRRTARRQLRQAMKPTRQRLRRVLSRQKAMRGARAR